MRLTWHIVRKDLLRLKWILLLWVVVLAGGLGLVLIQAGLDEEAGYPFYIAANLVTAGFLPLLMFGLVMGLLHDDPVAEIDAFWITRPISGRDLLLAKTTALLLLAFLPALVTIPFWLNYGYGFGQIGAAVRQTVGAQWIIVVLALPFAVLSANGSKFVMNVILGAGGLVLLAAIYRFGSRAEDRPLAQGLVQSKAWLMVWLWCAMTVAVTLIQFLKRRTRLSRAVLILTAVAGFAGLRWWPGEISRAANAPVELEAAGPIKASRGSTENDKPGAEDFLAKIDGEAKRKIIVAEAPLREGASAIRRGRMLKIQHVLLDFTGELQVEFSEATPRLSAKFSDGLPGTKPRVDASEFYFVLNRSDGRALAVSPNRSERELDAATLRFSHARFRVRPANSWQGSGPTDLAAWLKGAVLIKVAVIASHRPDEESPRNFP